MDIEVKEKKLKLMRYWLFGLFVIVFAAFSIYFGMFVGSALFMKLQYWISIALAAVLCVAGFYFYKWYLDRK